MQVPQTNKLLFPNLQAITQRGLIGDTTLSMNRVVSFLSLLYAALNVNKLKALLHSLLKVVQKII